MIYINVIKILQFLLNRFLVIIYLIYHIFIFTNSWKWIIYLLFTEFHLFVIYRFPFKIWHFFKILISPSVTHRILSLKEHFRKSKNPLPIFFFFFFFFCKTKGSNNFHHHLFSIIKKQQNTLKVRTCTQQDGGGTTKSKSLKMLYPLYKQIVQYKHEGKKTQTTQTNTSKHKYNTP